MKKRIYYDTGRMDFGDDQPISVDPNAKIPGTSFIPRGFWQSLSDAVQENTDVLAVKIGDLAAKGLSSSAHYIDPGSAVDRGLQKGKDWYESWAKEVVATNEANLEQSTSNAGHAVGELIGMAVPALATGALSGSLKAASLIGKGFESMGQSVAEDVADSSVEALNKVPSETEAEQLGEAIQNIEKPEVSEPAEDPKDTLSKDIFMHLKKMKGINKAMNRSGLINGFLGRMVKNNLLMTPYAFGAAIHTNKDGNLELHAKEGVINMIIGNEFAGVVEALPYLHIGTTPRGRKRMEAHGDAVREMEKEEEIKKEKQEEGEEKETPSKDAKLKGNTPIAETLSENEKKTIDEMVFHKINNNNNILDSVVNLDDEGNKKMGRIVHLVPDEKFLFHRNNSHILKQIRKIITHHLLYLGKRIDLNDPMDRAKIKKFIDDFKATEQRKGIAGLYLNEQIQKHLKLMPLEKRKKFTEDIDRRLHHAMPYRNKGAKNKAFYYSETEGMMNFNSPHWYRIPKVFKEGGEEDVEALALLRKEAKSGNKAAQYMEALYHHEFNSLLFKSHLPFARFVRMAIDNPHFDEVEEAEPWTEHQTRVREDIENEIRKEAANEEKYTNEDSPYYVKLLAKSSKQKWMAYIDCVVGNG